MPAAKEDYDVLEVIGQGSFGKVCRVRRNEDGKVCGCVHGVYVSVERRMKTG